jgi:hypothetical protein
MLVVAFQVKETLAEPQPTALMELVAVAVAPVGPALTRCRNTWAETAVSVLRLRLPGSLCSTAAVVVVALTTTPTHMLAATLMGLSLEMPTEPRLLVVGAAAKAAAAQVAHMVMQVQG